jgi:hypothetical protein
MKAIAEDAARVRVLAKTLLATDRDWTDWELAFLETLANHFGPDALSTRQREKLVELRDDAQRISTYRGLNIAGLIRDCWLARLDLGDDDEGFIETLKGATTIKRRQLGQLLRCCRKLGVID